MKKILPGLLAGLCLGCGATWLALRHPAASKPEEPGPVLDITTASAAIAKQLAAVGLTFAAPETTLLAPEVKGYGRVLDSTPFVTLAADIELASSVADGSAQEFARIKSLRDQGENASLQAVETAEAAMQRDRTQLASAQARLFADWGRPLARRPDLPELRRALVAGEAAVVRIDLLPGETPSSPPATARVSSLAAEGSWSQVELLGAAPSADPQIQGAGYLALWRGAALPPGTALRARVATGGETRKSLVVPRGALVRHEGGVFVYVQIEGGGFERRLVTLGPAVANGIVVTEGVAETDQVVVTGAQQLLATEVLGSTGGGED